MNIKMIDSETLEEIVYEYTYLRSEINNIVDRLNKMADNFEVNKNVKSLSEIQDFTKIRDAISEFTSEYEEIETRLSEIIDNIQYNNSVLSDALRNDERIEAYLQLFECKCVQYLHMLRSDMEQIIRQYIQYLKEFEGVIYKLDITEIRISKEPDNDDLSLLKHMCETEAFEISERIDCFAKQNVASFFKRYCNEYRQLMNRIINDLKEISCYIQALITSMGPGVPPVSPTLIV